MYNMSGHSSKPPTSLERGNRTLPPLQPNDSKDITDAGVSRETQRGDGIFVQDSPANYSTSSIQSPQSATLRSRKTKPPSTASPSYTQATMQKGERVETHVDDRSVSKALQRSILHILSIAVTSILFVLCAANIYMGDLDGFPDQDIAIQALQFVVKAHEILMTMSLGDIVLHRIRYDLIVRSGIPFGLLSSAYQLDNLGYLFSPAFRASFWRSSAYDRSFSRLILALLVVVSSLLFLVVGPSSGVLFIPKLSWWPIAKPFGRTTLRVFSSYKTQTQAWPSKCIMRVFQDLLNMRCFLRYAAYVRLHWLGVPSIRREHHQHVGIKLDVQQCFWCDSICE